MTIEYQVRARKVGGSWTTYEGIAATQTSISSLDDNSNYEWQVRQVENAGGVIYPSVWASLATFSTLVDSNVNAGLGTASETDTANSIDPVGDVFAPVITLVGGPDVSHVLGQPWVDPGYSAVDDVDGSVSVSVNGTIDVNSNSYQELEYSATDAAGNTATVTRTVGVAALAAPDSYEIQWREQGGSFTSVTGITNTQYALSGLTESTTIEWQIRAVGSSSESAWSAMQSFDTIAAAHVNANIGTATEGGSAGGVTPSIDADTTAPIGTASESDSANGFIPTVGNDVAAGVGEASESDTANSITPNASVDVSANMDAASETGTANAISATNGQTSLLQPNRYTLELEHIGGSVTTVNDISTSEYTATLTPENSYRFRVKAYPRNIFIEGDWSEWSEPFHVYAENPHVSLALTQPQLAATEALFITTNDSVIGSTAGFSTGGTTNQNNCTVSVTIDGMTYDAMIDGDTWTLSNPFRYALAATGDDEYDPKSYFKIVGELAQPGANILVVR